MTEKEIMTSIKSYEARRDERKKTAIEAIEVDNWWLAHTAISDAAEYDAIANEYRFILDLEEVR